MVLCVDEKTQIQALERTQPMLPLGLSYVEGVILDIHLIVDNYCTHKHSKVKK